MRSIDIDKVSLDVSPQVLAFIAKLDPNGSDVDFEQLEKILKSDHGMTSVVLRVANAKFFSHGKQITTLKGAMGVLGFKMLRSLTMLVSIRSLFRQNIHSRFKNYVWQPSIATALISKEIGLKLKHTENSEEYFVLGLLHKMGQVVFNFLDKSQFIKVLNELDKEEKASLEIEKEYFQIDHIEMGQQAASAWGLPSIYQEGIKYYKQLDRVKEEVTKDSQVSIYILGLASCITNKSDFGYPPDIAEENFQIALDALQIPKNQLAYLTEEYPKELIHNADYKYYFSLL